MKPALEIEQRYKISDSDEATALLARRGVVLRDEQHIIDKWFIPQSVRTRDDHDRWFDQDHGLAYRIRAIVGADGAPESIVLDSKQHTEANDHNTFNERVVMQDDEAAMVRFLENEHYYNWLTIDKTRRRFYSPESQLVIVMDSVSGIKDALGIDTVLEIEYSGDASRESALALINEFARTLGLTEEQRFAKSLTVESMRVLAHFQ